MLKKRRIKPRERVRALVEEPRNLVKNKLLVTFEVSTHVTVNGNTPYLFGFDLKLESVSGVSSGTKFLQKLLSY